MPLAHGNDAVLVPPARTLQQRLHQLAILAHGGMENLMFCVPCIVCSAIPQAGTKDTIARCNQWVALLGFAPNLFVLLSGRRPQRLAGRQFMPGFAEEEGLIKGSHSTRSVKASTP